MRAANLTDEYTVVIGDPPPEFEVVKPRVDFARIESRTNLATKLCAVEVAGHVVRAVLRVLNGRMRELTDESVEDVATVKLDGADVGRIKRSFRTALDKAWLVGATSAAREIKKPMSFAASLRDVAAAYFEANSFRMAANVSEGVRAIIQQELINAIKSGADVVEVMARILERLIAKGYTTAEAVAGELDDDDIAQALDDMLLEAFGKGLPEIPSYINTLVRTNVFEAMNEARFAEFTAPENSDFVVALEYSAIMDDNTTEICRHLDDKKYRADNPVWASFRPPNHFNCRSLLIPVTAIDGWNGIESPLPTVQPQDGFAFACDCNKRVFGWDPAKHGRDEEGKFDGSGATLQAVGRAAGGDGASIDIEGASLTEARELGSTLKGKHAYISYLSRSTSVKGAGRRVMEAVIKEADKLGVHLLVGAADDGSGKLYTYYEQFGFERVKSAASDNVMLRPHNKRVFGWDESKVKREPKGQGDGGQFANKDDEEEKDEIGSEAWLKKVDEDLAKLQAANDAQHNKNEAEAMQKEIEDALAKIAVEENAKDIPEHDGTRQYMEELKAHDTVMYNAVARMPIGAQRVVAKSGEMQELVKLAMDDEIRGEKLVNINTFDDDMIANGFGGDAAGPLVFAQNEQLEGLISHMEATYGASDQITYARETLAAAEHGTRFEPTELAGTADMSRLFTDVPEYAVAEAVVARGYYTAQEYRAINTYLRTGEDLWEGTSAPDLQKVVDSLDELADRPLGDYIFPHSDSARVYRGVFVTPEMADEFIPSLKVGASFRDPGFFSTTTSAYEAHSQALDRGTYHGRHAGAVVLFEVEIPDTQRGFIGNIGEGEIVLPRDTEFEVTGHAMHIKDANQIVVKMRPKKGA